MVRVWILWWIVWCDTSSTRSCIGRKSLNDENFFCFINKIQLIFILRKPYSNVTRFGVPIWDAAELRSPTNQYDYNRICSVRVFIPTYVNCRHAEWNEPARFYLLKSLGTKKIQVWPWSLSKIIYLSAGDNQFVPIKYLTKLCHTVCKANKS